MVAFFGNIMYNIIVSKIKKVLKEEQKMKRLYKLDTMNTVLRGEYWDEVRSKSMLSKYRMIADGKQTFEWMVMFHKTNGALQPADLSPRVVDKQTGAINGALFKYIPWYLGYTGTDFNTIVSPDYVPDPLVEPLDMIAAQLTLETSKYNEINHKKKDTSYLAMIEGEKKKEPAILDPSWESLKGTILDDAINQKPSFYLEDGVPQVYKPLREQLVGPCLGIHNVVIDTLKAYGYNNPLFTEKVRYFGLHSVDVPMLTTLFVMYIIKRYFANKASYKGNNKSRYARLRIDSDRNKKMVQDEITAALAFEDKISGFWRAVKQRSPFNPWERQNYNTVINTEEMLDRSEVNLFPTIDDFRLDEYNDLGHFPEMSLF